MLNHIHHINLLVRDLDEAMARYRDLLAIDSFEVADLPGRGVRTARFRAGESWVVLVQPTDAEGAPAQHLARHGEGLFLLSFGVDSLGRAMEHLAKEGGLAPSPPRRGLEGWRVADLDPAAFAGAVLQLTEDPADEG